MTAVLLSLCLTISAADASPPKVELLWPKGAPGAIGDTDADRPSLTVFLPPADKANGTAVVVCPGGGYQGLARTYEGNDLAKFFNQQGIAGFVLQYRLAPRYKHPIPMQDVQRAIRTVRARAREWQIDPRRIGVMGFSAGGHLASTAATHFDDGNADAEDPIEKVSCRPDFAILCYPVITMKPPYTHGGSRKNLLGENPDPSLVDLMSNDEQVTARTPPTFLFHTSEDTAVPPENSVLFYMALRKHKVPAELHVYEKGRHGVGLAVNDPVLSSWGDRLTGWLGSRGLLKKSGGDK
jgi:acetyl esterase/lipase